MTISRELLDELPDCVERPEDFLGDKGLMKALKVRLMERMPGAELTGHLGYEPNGEPASQQANRRGRGHTQGAEGPGYSPGRCRLTSRVTAMAVSSRS